LCEPDMGGQDPGSYGWPQYPRTAAEEQRYGLRGIAGALEKRPREWGILILADSKAAIQTVKKARRTGKARMGGTCPEVRRRQKQGQWWDRGVLTGGRIKQQPVPRRKAERAQVGWSKGRAARWEREGSHQIYSLPNR
jgi:hypothetical protein